MQAEITKSGQFLYFYLVTLCPKILSNCSINPFYGAKNLECIIFNWPEEVNAWSIMQNIYKLPDTVENVRRRDPPPPLITTHSAGKNEPMALVKWGEKKNLGGIGKKSGSTYH